MQGRADWAFIPWPQPITPGSQPGNSLAPAPSLHPRPALLFGGGSGVAFPASSCGPPWGFDDGGRWLMAPEGNDPEPVEPARSDCACRIREFHTTGLSEGPRQGRDRLGGGPRGERNARCARWPECEFPGAARVASRGLAGEPELSRSQ